MGLFGNRRNANLKSATEMVERVIAEIGLSPAENRLETEDNSFGWGLMRGSAQVFIFIRPPAEDEEFSSIQVISPMVRLPTHAETRLVLYQHLLELNATAITGAAFGVKDDTVVIITDRTTNDLDRSEVKEMILRVGYYADIYDDALVNQFGGLRFSD